MAGRIVGLLFGVAIGFIMAWARVTDPDVIHRMLLLREADVFLLMGSAALVAAVGVRLLRSSGIRAVVTGEPIAWALERPQARHVVGSVVFGAGWSVAGTCPAPLAAMIGEGRIAGLFVVAGIVGGVLLQRVVLSRRSVSLPAADGCAAGL